jgi:hypothetical protein
MKLSVLSLLSLLEERGALKVEKRGDALLEACDVAMMELSGISSSSSLSSSKLRSRGRPRKEKKEKVRSVVGEDAIGKLCSEICEEESIKVKSVLINGDRYLISSSSIVYSIDSHEELGSYIDGKLLLDEKAMM